MSPLLRLFRVALISAIPLNAADGDDSPVLHFERDARPILKAHCWQCHGEEEEVKGGEGSMPGSPGFCSRAGIPARLLYLVITPQV